MEHKKKMSSVKRFYIKWIQGECRHLCIICPYFKEYCMADFGLKCIYSRGYSDGYDAGYEAAMKKGK